MKFIQEYVTLGQTSSSREDGSAPVKEAINILVRVAPRGSTTLSIMGRYFSPAEQFARSNTSDKNVNIDLQASLHQYQRRETGLESRLILKMQTFRSTGNNSL